MKKNVICNLLIAAFVTGILSGCGSENVTNDSEIVQEEVINDVNENDSLFLDSGDVTLHIWIDEENKDLTQKMVDSFCEAHKGEANFDIQIDGVESGIIRGEVLKNVLEAGDIIAFPDDQLNGYISAGFLEPVSEQEAVKEANVAEAIKAASYNDVIYAFPYTADNGYFLYYNKDYFTEQDVQTLDGILKVAEEAEKKVSMEFDSGWYLYSFFGNTGLEVGINEDGVTNYCTWNSKENPITGEDVTKALKRILENPAFLPQADAGFVSGMKDGTVIAGISGTWNAMEVKEAWGEDYGAVKLPTYTVAGQQVQMASFTGYRMMGVNYYSKHKGWAMLLADWLTNEENQTLRFVERNMGPSNIKAAASDEVSKVPAIQAILAQSEYGKVQRIGNKYWNACTDYTSTLIQGNPNNYTDEELIEKLVNSITASAAN